MTAAMLWAAWEAVEKDDEPARNMLGDRVVDDEEFVTAKGDPKRHED